METNTQPFITWVSPPTPRPSRGRFWYTATISLGLLLLGHSLLNSNWLFAILILGIAGYYKTEERWVRKKNRIVSLAEDGVTIDGRLTPWTGFLRVWFRQHPQGIELNLERIAGLTRREALSLPPEIDQRKLIEIFQSRIPLEINHRETILDIIINLLKI